MSLRHRVLLILIALSVPSTLYLYLYPFFHGCGFPRQDASLEFPQPQQPQQQKEHFLQFSSPRPIAPFRLLALGDPQLEGDSSLPKLPRGPSLQQLWQTLRSSDSWLSGVQQLGEAGRHIFLDAIPLRVIAWHKQLDLLGNDWYLAHVYRTMHWYTQPTHVTVLGDLLGSQWVDDDEFRRRSRRFWRRVMRGSERVDEDTMAAPAHEMLGQDSRWARRIMAVVGNHDVGYAGDMTEAQVERFEREFGHVNWEITFHLSRNDSLADDTAAPQPSLRIIVFNSMNLDAPARSSALQADTYDFLNAAILRSSPVEDRSSATLLLTHIPLYKPAGVCVDAPYFSYHPPHSGGGISEQNHLSYGVSLGVLEGLFGMSANRAAPAAGRGRRGVILTGHDHEGCDIYHHVWRGAADSHADVDQNALPSTNEKLDEIRWWNASRWEDPATAATVADPDVPGVREITVRSMMGDFGGNVGLLSAWFDEEGGEWRFAYETCHVGVQHIWWAVHVLLLVTVVMAVWVGGMVFREWVRGGRLEGEMREQDKKKEGTKEEKDERMRLAGKAVEKEKTEAEKNKLLAKGVPGGSKGKS